MEKNTYKLLNLHLRLTERCNKSCAHCFAGINNNSIDLPLSYWIGIIQKAKEMGTENITLTGGEPFVYTYFDELLDEVIKMNVIFSIETNGILLGKYCKKLLKASKLKKISVSPDLSYSESEVKSLFEKVISMKLKGLPIQIQAAILPGEIEKKIQCLRKFAKEGVNVRVMLGHNGLGKSGMLEENLNYSEMIRVYKEIKNDEKILCDLPPLITGEKKKCSCGWNSVRGDIMPDGRLTPCAAIAWNLPEFVLDYVDSENLEKVWNENEKLNKIRKLTREKFGGACKKCDYFEYCKGSCVAVNLGIKGNILSGYPLCEFFEEREKK